MSAEVETMAYVGETPWHKLGTYVGEDNVLSGEMLVLAGLNWLVAARALFTSTAPKAEGGRVVGVEDHKAIVRLSDGKVLSVVGGSYQPLQNHEMFDTMDALVSDGLMKYHTAGSLYGGRKIWALGKVGSAEIVPGDRVDNFLMGYSGHDGLTGSRLIWTTVRAVCANTTRAALDEAAGEGVSVRHTKNQKKRLSEASKILGIAQANFEKSTEFYRALAKTKLTEERWVKLAGELIPNPSSGSAARAIAKREELTRLLFRGRGQDLSGVEGTLWAARNAVSEYVNYARQSRGDEETAQENRFSSSLFGAGASLVRSADELMAEWIGDRDLEPSYEPVDALSLMSDL